MVTVCIQSSGKCDNLACLALECLRSCHSEHYQDITLTNQDFIAFLVFDHTSGKMHAVYHQQKKFSVGTATLLHIYVLVPCILTFLGALHTSLLFTLKGP